MPQVSPREFRTRGSKALKLRRAMAKASLRANWRLAQAVPITDGEIDHEIKQVRNTRREGSS